MQVKLNLTRVKLVFRLVYEILNDYFVYTE